MLGVGLKVEYVKRSTERESPPVMLTKKNHPEPQSFAEAIFGSNLRDAKEIVKVGVGEEETKERLEKLSRCLAGWWGKRHLSDAGSKDPEAKGVVFLGCKRQSKCHGDGERIMAL